MALLFDGSNNYTPAINSFGINIVDSVLDLETVVLIYLFKWNVLLSQISMI